MEQTSEQTGKPAEKTAREEPPPISVMKKEGEGPWLRDEVLKQIEWQQPLFLAIYFGGATFLSLGLQPGISGLTAMLFPIAALALALKLSAHDLRTGQINFYLRYGLRSPWEIVRRALFDGSTLSKVEQQVLGEQGIAITDELRQAAKNLRPPIADMHSVANRLAFFTFEAASLGIGVIRTYPAVLGHDLLTIFVWVLSCVATFLTVLVLQRKRVR